jgi:hypothetical protein
MRVCCCIVIRMAATTDEILDAFSDNADYEETQSLPKARAFVTACVRLIGVIPQSQSDQGSSVAYSIPQVQALMQRAQNWIVANQTSAGGRVAFYSVNGGGFR